LGYTPANEAEVVKSIAVNGTTYNRDANGSVDLGTISGSGGASLLSKSFTYTSGAQTFTADFDIVQVGNILVGGTPLQKTQYTVSGAVVTILDTLTSGAVIELNYWKANAVNATNYTKAESDSLLATKENSDNKSTSVITDKASNIKFPSVKSVYDWAVGLFATIANLNLKAPKASPTFTGTVTLPTGTSGKIPKYTSAGVLGDSVITEFNGKVGIDTTNPEYPLEVNGDTRISGNLRLNNSIADPSFVNTGYIRWAGNSLLLEQPNRMLCLPKGDRFEVLDEAGSAFLVGFHGSNSSTPDSIRLYNGVAIGSYAKSGEVPNSGLIVSGNVGIGNNNPYQKLDITGNIRLSGIHMLGQYTTATRPAYVKGSQFFDTTINKMVIGGATAWEVVTSS